ncbi:protein-L-isoaspartate(D-aspartate) O-methyltransferase [Streptomyces sp. NBC_01230]|uniref:protein-L-isoaspartate(D-aspartate) O-methyltransferase n=1 Tax=Streptomyces sp. NBC_01230 TaxID=2903784 RepID=UPI002E0F1480|nr:protein-L-isoaspartate(D-aspartate) O-methyltransferase [Streptomyces sp. NBC_01230]
MTVQVEDRERTLRLALADTLADEGALRDDRWRKAVEEVPRHVFVPAYWRLGADGQPLRVERDDPAWLEGAYADAALTVQMTDGVATSSSTAPSLMLRMLEALDIDDTALVQEIGTGTGYNTALLCHRLSSEQVVTVEVDPQLADAAEARLNMLGWHPAVRVGDGALGVVGTRRFDALIATCAMPDIPGAWLTQTRPGAVLVVPFGTGVVRLVRDENGTASGSFQPWPAFFMAARDAGGTGAVPYPGEPASVTERPTNLAPHEVAADNFAFACSLLLPHTACGRTLGPDGQVTSMRLWDREGSWADVADGTVRQAGPSRLWDEVEVLWAKVTGDCGRPPARNQYGMTVTPDGSSVWLDHPGRLL